MIIYGIKNCDKVRTALKQAKADGHEAILHDYRVDGVDESLVLAMLKDIPMVELLNKRSATWKQLSDQQRSQIDVTLLINYPTLIKRPVVSEGVGYRLGY